MTNHDYAAFLRDAIDSALAQDHPDVEVVVVDDGSTDESPSIIASYGDRVIPVIGPNRGQGHAVNVGFAASSGDVVVFLDADDRLRPDAARRVAQLFAERPDLSRVQMPLAVIDARGRPTGERIPRAGRRLFSGDARGRLVSCPDDIAWQPTSGNAFARTALERSLPMAAEPYRLCADYHLSTITPLHGSVMCLDEPGGEYRIHGSNGHIRRTTLDRVRTDIARTLTTRSTLIAATRELGLPGLPDDPADVRSISHVGLRAVSYRLDRRHHPVAHDSRRRLAELAIASARARRDLGLLRRIAASTWALSLLVLPRPAVRRLARPVLGGPLTT